MKTFLMKTKALLINWAYRGGGRAHFHLKFFFQLMIEYLIDNKTLIDFCYLLLSNTIPTYFLGCLFKSQQQVMQATTAAVAAATTTTIVNTNSSVRPETVAMKHFCQMMIRPHQQWKGRLLKSFTRPSPTGKLIFYGSYICMYNSDGSSTTYIYYRGRKKLSAIP